MSSLQELPISQLPATLPRRDLWQMLRLVRLLFQLSCRESYRQLVYPELPEVARFDPGHASLMMGYDFHLTPDGARLIEINTNAGGGYIAWLSEAQAHENYPILLSERIQKRLLDSFRQEWRDFSGSDRPLQRIVIVDEDPSEQPLYPEMVACRDWLRKQGLSVEIAPPAALNAGDDGVFLEGAKIDLVYNRHCDFYLAELVMTGLRQAYLQRKVCLSPNPFAYGLLADKRRMILWSDPARVAQLGLEPAEQKLLPRLVPYSRLLQDCELDAVWAQRKKYVFKPVAKFGSRGVLMGKSISRKRFSELDAAITLVQQVESPSVETSAEGDKFKVDLRLFVYRDRLLGVGARLYQGQVTNLRTVGGGFAPIKLI